MSQKRKRSSNQPNHNTKNNFNDNNNENNKKNSTNNTNPGSISWNNISDEDKQSIELLIIQLKSIVTDLCAYILI